MPLSLRISMPAKPYMKNNPRRLVYRVVFSTGREISLKQLADKLDIPYTTVFQAVRLSTMSVGTHTDAFMMILAAIQARRKLTNRARTVPCPHCKGRGRVPR